MNSPKFSAASAKEIGTCMQLTMQLVLARFDDKRGSHKICRSPYIHTTWKPHLPVVHDPLATPLRSWNGSSDWRIEGRTSSVTLYNEQSDHSAACHTTIRAVNDN